MPISIQYESVEEATMRLQGTIVFYDGEPVYVYKVTEGKPHRIHFTPLPLVMYDPKIHDKTKVELFSLDGCRAYFVAEQQQRKFISSKNFDYGATKVGFVSVLGNDKPPVYLARSTARQYQQGLKPRNCEVFNKTNIFDGENVGLKDADFNLPLFYHLMTTQAFVDALKGNNSKETLATGDKKNFGVLSSDFAWFFSKDFGLKWLYTSDFVRVGVMHKGSLAFQVPKRFSYLRESLEKANIIYTIGD